MEILVSISIVMVLAGITLQVMKNGREKAHLVRATQKIKDLGQSFMAYTGENGGLLPRENHSGTGDTWEAACEPEAREVWYNALLWGMSRKSVGDIGEDPETRLFYEDAYPLYVPGAPYPKSEKKTQESDVRHRHEQSSAASGKRNGTQAAGHRGFDPGSGEHRYLP